MCATPTWSTIWSVAATPQSNHCKTTGTSRWTTCMSATLNGSHASAGRLVSGNSFMSLHSTPTSIQSRNTSKQRHWVKSQCARSSQRQSLFVPQESLGTRTGCSDRWVFSQNMGSSPMFPSLMGAKQRCDQYMYTILEAGWRRLCRINYDAKE